MGCGVCAREPCGARAGYSLHTASNAVSRDQPCSLLANSPQPLARKTGDRCRSLGPSHGRHATPSPIMNTVAAGEDLLPRRCSRRTSSTCNGTVRRSTPPGTWARRRRNGRSARSQRKPWPRLRRPPRHRRSTSLPRLMASNSPTPWRSTLALAEQPDRDAPTSRFMPSRGMLPSAPPSRSRTPATIADMAVTARPKPTRPPIKPRPAPGRPHPPK